MSWGCSNEYYQIVSGSQDANWFTGERTGPMGSLLWQRQPPPPLNVHRLPSEQAPLLLFKDGWHPRTEKGDPIP